MRLVVSAGVVSNGVIADNRREVITVGWLERIDRMLNDAVLGALALISLFVGLAPFVFDTTSSIVSILDRVELGIVALFALEYTAALLTTSERWKFVRNPWRLLDALIVGLSLASLFPIAHSVLRNAPALRILRLGRFALFGVRAGTALAVRDVATAPTSPASSGDFRIAALSGDDTLELEEIDWTTGLSRIRTETEDWLFLRDVDAERLAALAPALGVPEATLRARFFDSTFPRIERMDRYTVMFAWYPSVAPRADGELPRVKRAPVLLVGSTTNVVVLTREAGDLYETTQRRLAEVDVTHPPLVRATYALLKSIVRQYTRVAETLETALIEIESGQAQLSDRLFLDRTFRLRAEISRVRGSMKHLKDVLRVLAEKPVAIRGLEKGRRPLFELLADDGEEVYESVDDTMTSVAALVDLRLNLASFQMNKVMRLLAILTTLTLIPAVTGGLLGMNVEGNPWSATLGQVTYGVAAGMAISLYVFAVKGWLR